MDAKELLFEVTAHITGNIEYGASLQAIASGKSPPPPEGARFDISLEGTVDGPKLKGKLYSMDHSDVRADGRISLHVHARFELADGGKVAVSGEGQATPDPTGIFQLRETLTMRSNSTAHSWVNSTSVWASGTANLATGELRLKGYKA